MLDLCCCLLLLRSCVLSLYRSQSIFNVSCQRILLDSMSLTTKCTNCNYGSVLQRVNDHTYCCPSCSKYVDTPLAEGRSKACSAYLDLYASGANTDVTFVFPDETEIRAHKLILTTRVPYFEKMFSSGMKESLTNRVDVPDADKDSFDAFLRFIYGGSLPKEYDVEAQPALAQKYDVPGLLPFCLPKLRKDLVETSGFDFNYFPTQEKLECFGNCIVKAAHIMENIKFSVVKAAMVEELLRLLRQMGNFSLTGDIKKTFVLLVVDLLVVSHVHDCPNLKSACLDELKRKLSKAMLADAGEKLKEHPDLLFHVVLQFRRV